MLKPVWIHLKAWICVCEKHYLACIHKIGKIIKAISKLFFFIFLKISYSKQKISTQ